MVAGIRGTPITVLNIGAETASEEKKAMKKARSGQRNSVNFGDVAAAVLEKSEVSVLLVSSDSY